MPGETLEQLKARLDEFYTWPANYMFKFIVPADKLEELKTVFGGKEITTRDSANGRFVSITAEYTVQSSDEVMLVYERAQAIEGVISL